MILNICCLYIYIFIYASLLGHSRKANNMQAEYVLLGVIETRMCTTFSLQSGHSKPKKDRPELTIASEC